MSLGDVLPFAGVGSISGTSDHQVLADFTRIFDGLRVATKHLDATQLSELDRADILVALARASLAVLDANRLFVAQMGRPPCGDGAP
ncbi:hypothetical protein E8L99_12825 [Phreatobacter aquaticus]|uniref:Uncharacterized protein n=1 Tax=Phreatobacter aquaticus TaxID=2570229 RepID=A0A4D7QNM4_9HYPH|nr:hypothetical protein [Phreatobacter aquaticus]QCK86577.1 hypothetical protein E8L99_12825 [Phreatobacter aquaticus]